MKTSNKNILVLLDLNKKNDHVIDNTIKLAKDNCSSVEFLSVKSKLRLLKGDNQLSAKRQLNDELKAEHSIQRKIKELRSECPSLSIKQTVTTGSPKATIKNHLKKNDYDVVVLGKRQVKPIHLFGNNVTKTVVSNYDGDLFITDSTNNLNQIENKSIGVLERPSLTEVPSNPLEAIVKEKPVKRFRILGEKATLNADTSNEVVKGYEFEENDKTFNTLSNYIKKDNVGVLCLAKPEKKNARAKFNSDLNNAMKKFNCSLWISNLDTAQ
ncbi:universal stress protein [Winogradskyella maritima]|uniref:Universal stress protein n=1 Tax=Winogradskyella maritima TaxID=1517766 RepID=A0ABV8ANP8_9FLAO|nr:universal stress protein [Winogradskyella maritima]